MSKTAVVTGGTRGNCRAAQASPEVDWLAICSIAYLVADLSTKAAGIGLGIATCMARDGYSLVLGFNANVQAAAQAKQHLEEEYEVRVVVVGGDVAAPATMQELFKAVEEDFDNNCTAFVHNAGLNVEVTTESSKLSPAADAEFDHVWDYYQRMYPQAFKRGVMFAQNCKGLKHVLAISSPGCNATRPPRVRYESPGQAKAAVEFLVRTQASALASRGIHVNCVAPGLVRTEAWTRQSQKMGISGEQLEHFADGTPAQRWADPVEVGEAVAFLCSSKASFITGISMPVDGGLHLQHAPLFPPKS